MSDYYCMAKRKALWDDHNATFRLRIEVDRLKADNERLRKDAARYRWLRDGGDHYLLCINPDVGQIGGEDLDAIIDAALSAVPSGSPADVKSVPRQGDE